MHLQDKFSFEDFRSSLSKLIQDESLRQDMKDNLNKVKLGIGYEDFKNISCF